MYFDQVAVLSEHRVIRSLGYLRETPSVSEEESTESMRVACCTLPRGGNEQGLFAKSEMSAEQKAHFGESLFERRGSKARSTSRVTWNSNRRFYPGDGEDELPAIESSGGDSGDGCNHGQSQMVPTVLARKQWCHVDYGWSVVFLRTDEGSFFALGARSGESF
jgi:hypothetical protein